MNWCPVLKETGKNEDPVFLFPDDSVDVIRAFVRFVYEGFFVLTESVTVEQVLDFMSRIGLDLPHGSYRVINYTIHKSNLYLQYHFSDHTIQHTRHS